MTSRFTEICIDAHDMKKQAEFWCAVLGYKIIDEQEDVIEIGPEDMPVGWSDESAAEWKARARAAPPVPTIVFALVPEGKTVKNRVHIDVSPTGSHEEEVERVLALGATRADIGQGDVRWEVMRDPEGNEFCILRSLAP
jgi:catechol 2,3-dioxygenase-like lactoylglutathione lyase family enzyme